jgi:hypothetical protein
MTGRWFSHIGWFYVPVLLFCTTVFVAVDRHSHSVSDTLYGIFPFFVCTFLLVDWVGSRTCDTDRPAVR